MSERDAASDLAICDAATAGPWGVPVPNVFRVFAWSGNTPTRCIVNDTALDAYWGRDEIKWPETEEAGIEAAANAKFIALAREALPHWIREAERLRAENERLGAKVVGLEMRVHGLESALAIWRDDDDE